MRQQIRVGGCGIKARMGRKRDESREMERGIM